MTHTMHFPGYGHYIQETNPGKPPVVSVLYVDDDPILLELCKLYLEQNADISVSVSSSVEEALALIDTTPYDVIISDYQMPGINGIGFLKFLKDKHCSVPFILFTGKGREVLAEAISNGAMFCIHKSGHPRSQFSELEKKIREAFRRRRTGFDTQESGLQYRTFYKHSGSSDQ